MLAIFKEEVVPANVEEEGCVPVRSSFATCWTTFLSWLEHLENPALMVGRSWEKKPLGRQQPPCTESIQCGESPLPCYGKVLVKKIWQYTGENAVDGCKNWVQSWRNFLNLVNNIIITHNIPNQRSSPSYKLYNFRIII